MLYENNPVLYENSPVLYENNPVLYDNNPVLYENNPVLYENNPVLYENNPVLYENNPVLGTKRQSVGAAKLLHPLPISADNAANAGVHHPRHMDNGMQMVGHKAKLENVDCRIVPAHHIELVNNSIAQWRPLYPSLRGSLSGITKVPNSGSREGTVSVT